MRQNPQYRGKYFYAIIIISLVNFFFLGSISFRARLGGGEGGIRTLGRGKPTHAFQACALNRSATSPVKLKARAFGIASASRKPQPSWSYALIEGNPPGYCIFLIAFLYIG